MAPGGKELDLLQKWKSPKWKRGSCKWKRRGGARGRYRRCAVVARAFNSSTQKRSQISKLEASLVCIARDYVKEGWGGRMGTGLTNVSGS